MDKLKRVVIKEELVKLTGDVDKAAILNQFIYWSERTKDVDKYILEERNRASKNGEDININLTNGWIYKTGDEMAEEIMICKPRTAARKMAELVEMGYLEQRNNPYNTWDRTLQYRVNFIKVIKDLNKLGYSLEDYPLYDKIKDTICQNDKCICQIDKSISQNGNSICHSGEAIPEITIENTIENINQSDQMEFEKIDDMLRFYSELFRLPEERVLSTYDRVMDQYKAGNIRTSFRQYFEKALKQEKADYEVNKFIDV